MNVKKNVSMKKLFLPLVLLCFITSCVKEEDLNPTQKQTLYSVSYGNHERNKLDITLPANRNTQTPVVIFIHGGAWVSGDRSVFLGELDQYAQQGIACATINYRYASPQDNVTHTEVAGDVKKAVDFIASKSQTWQVSPNRFGLVGHSAGGHLSLIASYALNDGKIKACASWAGPVDFTDNDQLAINGVPALFQVYMGRPLQSAADSAAYRAASPYWTATAQSVPTLLMYGTNDELVPYSTGLKMQALLQNLGVTHQFHTQQGAQHSWGGTHLNDARTLTLQWFQQHL